VSRESVRFAQNKNLMMRAVGVGADIEIEIHDYPTQPSDVYLLCSDGPSDMLAVNEINGILPSDQFALQIACNALIRGANDNGGHDNIAVILVGVGECRVEAGGLFSRLCAG